MTSPGLYRVPADDIPSLSMTRHCIVLDLDQTLIATQDNVDSLKILNIMSDPQLLSLRNRTYYLTIDDLDKPGHGTRYDFWGVTRPHITEFLIFCFSYFKIVAVWSAGRRPYVEAIVDHIFRASGLPMPHIVFTDKDIANGVEKPLEKMINFNTITQANMSLQNTFALDDNENTLIHNPYNGILIPAYSPVLTIDSLARDDPTLLQVKYWLLQPEIMNAEDITFLDKSHIFANSVDAYKERLKSIPGYNFV